MITDDQRIRVIRAILGMNSEQFAQRIGASATSVSNWEHGRTQPSCEFRQSIQQLCEEHEIGFSPSGFPFPIKDCVVFKP